MEEDTEISSDDQRNIEETLARLVRPKAKMVREEGHLYYVFSRKGYKLLKTHMEFLMEVIEDVFIDVLRDLKGYASLHPKDDKVLDKIKNTLDEATTIFNDCEKMSNDLLTSLDNLPHRAKDDPTVYTRMPVATYRLFVFACIGHCADMEWTKNTILRGDWENEG
ncbi:MAG: hypothetical protein LBC30_03325 [Puniceicoccales bacterium]|jgi:hypothetical protein|nr:hypothetical protein [Puniceicoccales bacterium]